MLRADPRVGAEVLGKRNFERHERDWGRQRTGLLAEMLRLWEHLLRLQEWLLRLLGGVLRLETLYCGDSLWLLGGLITREVFSCHEFVDFSF